MKAIELLLAWLLLVRLTAADTVGQEARLLDELAAALRSDDAGVREAAEHDVLNLVYREAPAEKMLPILLPLLKMPQADLQRLATQGLLMEYLAAVYGPRAKEVLPVLLAHVVDDKAPAYLRGRAIEAAAKIGPGDAGVVAALVKAIENPVPADQSGVHDRAAAWLGEMGRPALPARGAIRKLLSHHFDIVQDAAFVALGKLALAEKAPPLVEQVERLRSAEELSPDELAAALLAVRTASASDDAQARRSAALARPALVVIIQRPKGDVAVRDALRTLAAVGPSDRPEMVAALAAVLLRDNSSLAAEALAKVEPSDKAAVRPLVEAFAQELPRQDYFARVVLAETLARYGKDAGDAVPLLIEALNKVRRITARNDAYAGEIRTYLATLIAIGPETPGLAEALIARLNAEGPLLKESGQFAAEAQVPLLEALGRIGLPAGEPLRGKALGRLSEGLQSDRPDVFAAAAGAVARLDRRALGDDAASLSRLLLPVVKLGFEFRATGEGSGDPHAATLAAVQALGHLGPAARETLPALEKIAARAIKPRGDFEPEPRDNELIRAARAAVAEIKGNE